VSRKVLAALVAAVVLALAVWLVPTAFGSGGSGSSAQATTTAASAAPSPAHSAGTGCTHASTTAPQ